MFPVNIEIEIFTFILCAEKTKGISNINLRWTRSKTYNAGTFYVSCNMSVRKSFCITDKSHLYNWNFDHTSSHRHSEIA